MIIRNAIIITDDRSEIILESPAEQKNLTGNTVFRLTELTPALAVALKEFLEPFFEPFPVPVGGDGPFEAVERPD